MPRKNFGVRMGRPPATPISKMGKPPKMAGGPQMSAPMGASPMDSFSPGIPAAGFKRGGQAGYACMPQHHDDPNYCKGGKVR